MSDNEVATTILSQMGGVERVRAMLGVKQFVAKADGVSFRFPSGTGPNICEVLLDAGKDTYVMKFWRARGSDYKLLATHEDVYAEDLKRLFEKETGLYLSL